MTVAHVDEVVSFVETSNGWRCLVADLNLGIDLLFGHTNELEGSYTFTKNHLLSVYSNPEEQLYLETVRSGLAAIRTKLAQVLDVDETELIRVPVAFSPSHPLTGHRENLSHARLPNMVNLLFIRSPTGGRKILLPRPDYLPFQIYMEDMLAELGYLPDEYSFIDTSELHSGFGEVHCGTNVQRLRIQ